MATRGKSSGSRSGLAQEFKAALTAYEAGDLAKARKLLRPVVKALPDNVDAVHLLGVVATGLGDLEPAERLLVHATRLAPGNAVIWNNLGEALRRQSRHADALAAYDRAVGAQADFAGAHNNRAVVLLALGRPGEALEAAELALAKAPGMVMALINRGQALEDLQRGEEAEAVYRQALTRQPGNPQTLARLASSAAARKDYALAVKLFRDALAAAPADREILLNYGAVLQELARFEAAATLFADMARTFGNDPDVLHGLGKAMLSMDDIPAALKHLDAAASALGTAKPAELADVLTTRGTALLADGRDADAQTAFIEALKHDPDAVQTLRLLSANHKAVDTDDAYVARADDILRAGALPAASLKHVHYAAGKWREDLGELTAAADHYFKANAIHDGEHGYQPEQFAARVDELIAAFSPQFVAALPVLETEPEGQPTPIFIVGMPRSGSTLTEQILASHGAVHAFGEQTHLSSTISDTERRLGLTFPAGWTEAMATGDFGPQQARMINEDYRRRQQTRGGQVVPLADSVAAVTDKLLDNFVHLGMVRMVFPGARIINCIRDPLENALSIFKLVLHGHEYSTNPDNLAHRIAQYQRLMAHWHAVFPDWILPVSYEALIADPEPMTRKILAHCRLPWDDACLEPHKTKRVVRTLSISQVRQPMYKSSLKLSQRYGPALDPLRKALTDAGVAFGS